MRGKRAKYLRWYAKSTLRNYSESSQKMLYKFLKRCYHYPTKSNPSTIKHLEQRILINEQR